VQGWEAGLAARGKQVMTRIAQLREQASILRSLAGSIDVPAIRDQVLVLAGQCDALALLLEQDPPKADPTTGT
jgi:hypothetical protein